MKHINTQSVHSPEFGRFGQVLNVTDGTPRADEKEITYWGGIARFDFPAKLSSGHLISRHTGTTIERLERHTQTAEILVATGGDSIICMATPDSKVGDGNEHLGAFVVRQGEAIKMHAGTWHWLPIPTSGDEVTFLVLFADRTEDDDMEIVELREPVSVTAG